MAAVRSDLVGSVYAYPRSGPPTADVRVLVAGDTIPPTHWLPGTLVEGGDPGDTIPPWDRDTTPGSSRVSRGTLGPRVVVDGDSITYGGTTTTGPNQDRANSWPAAMALASLGAIDLVWNAAVAGQRSDQMLARFDEHVAAHAPAVVIATVGTNDVQQSRPRADWLADLEEYRRRVESIGAVLVVGAVPPTTAGGKGEVVPEWNAALRTWAAGAGLRVIAWDVFTDPVTGGWPDGWSVDGLHPTGTDSRQALGVFAWESIADMFGGPVLRTADRFGPGALTNGRFETVTTTAPPATLTPTAGTGGTLAEGRYTYRVTTRTNLGESALGPAAVVDVAADGSVALAWPTVAGNRGFRVYRRGPADVDLLLVAEVAAGTLTWTDTGAPAGERATGTDTSAYPSGLTWGSGSLVQRMGGGVYADPSVRGRVLRLLPYTTGALNSVIVSPQANGAPGDTFEVSGLVRGDGRNVATVYARLRTGTTQTGLVKVYEGLPLTGNRWGRFHARVTLPDGADNVLVLLVCNPGDGFVEYAEVRLQPA